jgi:hypothetical protein
VKKLSKFCLNFTKSTVFGNKREKNMISIDIFVQVSLCFGHEVGCRAVVDAMGTSLAGPMFDSS